MSIAAWPVSDLPYNKLFGKETGYDDNAITAQYDSGRRVSYQKNTKNRRTYAVSYAATAAQETAFLTWYENTLGGNAGTFTAASLRAGETADRAYMFTDTPRISGSGAIRTISMGWVEV